MIIKKSVNISGHSTSISIELEFWRALREISKNEKKSINQLILEIDRKRDIETNLSSATRLFVLKNMQNRIKYP